MHAGERRRPFYPTWTFAGHQPSSYQTHSDIKPITRKPSIKSTTLEGQTLDLSLPGHVYKQNIEFFGNSIFSSLAKLHHTLGIKNCMSQDGVYMVLDRFWQVLSPNYDQLMRVRKIIKTSPDRQNRSNWQTREAATGTPRWVRQELGNSCATLSHKAMIPRAQGSDHAHARGP